MLTVTIDRHQHIVLSVRGDLEGKPGGRQRERRAEAGRHRSPGAIAGREQGRGAPEPPGAEAR